MFLRHTRLAARIAHAAILRPAFPVKLNFALTYWCQYRCKTCNIWQQHPKDELTTAEVTQFFRQNRQVAWLDLMGGEITLRKDIAEIASCITAECRSLALLHFATNGYLPDRAVSLAKCIARDFPGTFIITVSMDGDKTLNDDIRGIPGGYERQIETFNRLRELPNVHPVLGFTLSTFNTGRFFSALESWQRDIPGLRPSDVHLNLAQLSGHYYANSELTQIAVPPKSAAEQIRTYRRLRGMPLSPSTWLEWTYLRRLEDYLKTGRTPMRCHSLSASCFIDPWGQVFPCISYDRCIGNLRQTEMNLAPIWNSDLAKATQQEIWSYNCPQCWTACEAYQTILCNTPMPWRNRS